MELQHYLKIIVEQDGSDLYFSTGAPPSMKVQGKLTAITAEPLAPDVVQALADALMDAEQ